MTSHRALHHGVFRNSINKRRGTFSFSVKDRIFDAVSLLWLYVFSLSSHLIRSCPSFLSPVFPPPPDWSIQYPPSHLPALPLYAIPIFHPSLGPEEKKTRNFTRPRRAYPRWDIKSILGDVDRSTWTTSENQGKLPAKFRTQLFVLTVYTTRK